MSNKSSISLLFALVVIFLIMMSGLIAEWVKDYTRHSTRGVVPEPKEHEVNMTIILIDGCQYLEFSQDVGRPTGSYSVTHKGNCTNHLSIVNYAKPNEIKN